MKKALPFIFLISTMLFADEVRVSIVFVHYSVGRQMVAAYCNIRESLDTLNVTVGEDTARIVFRDYMLNYENTMQGLRDTVHSGCEHVILPGMDYDLLYPYYRTIIGEDNLECALLERIFNKPNKEDSLFWKIFTEHNVPTSDGGNQLEKYDLIIIKNPYMVWFNMDPVQADTYRTFYETVRDSLSNHPEINYAFAFGTPLRINHECPDTTTAKLTYELANWFASDSFFTHTNIGPYKNIWKWNSYSHLCETSPGASNKYCLKTEYLAPGDGGSHLSDLGAEVSQESLVAFIRTAVEDILIQKSGAVTRRDIDRIILEFRNGNATLQEVFDLIEQYNSGGD